MYLYKSEMVVSWSSILLGSIRTFLWNVLVSTLLCCSPSSRIPPRRHSSTRIFPAGISWSSSTVLALLVSNIHLGGAALTFRRGVPESIRLYAERVYVHWHQVRPLHCAIDSASQSTSTLHRTARRMPALSHDSRRGSLPLRGKPSLLERQRLGHDVADTLLGGAAADEKILTPTRRFIISQVSEDVAHRFDSIAHEDSWNGVLCDGRNYHFGAILQDEKRTAFYDFGEDWADYI